MNALGPLLLEIAKSLSEYDQHLREAMAQQNWSTVDHVRRNIANLQLILRRIHTTLTPGDPS